MGAATIAERIYNAVGFDYRWPELGTLKAWHATFGLDNAKMFAS